MFRFEYAITFDEFYDGLASTQRKAFVRKYLIWGCVFIVAVLLFFSDLRRDRDIGFSLVLLLISGITLFFTQPLYKSTLKRLYSRSPSLSERSTVVFSDDAARWSNPVVETSMRWPAFSHWSETHRSFLLFRGPDVVVIVPKRVIEDYAQADVFRSLLIEKIGHTSLESSRSFPVQPTRTSQTSARSR